MVMLLFVPSSEMVKPLVVQFAVPKSGFCCSTKPAEDDGHEMMTLLAECVTVNVGAPGVCSTEIKLQKPPVTE